MHNEIQHDGIQYNCIMKFSMMAFSIRTFSVITYRRTITMGDTNLGPMLMVIIMVIIN